MAGTEPPVHSWRIEMLMGGVLLLVPIAWWSTSRLAGSALGWAAPASRAGTWSPTGSMPTARDWHSATWLPDGTVLVTGGFVGWPTTVEFGG